MTQAAQDRRTRRDTVRAALSRALLELLEETAFKDISVDDIAVAAGIKRSAFYFYFQDKQDLLVATAADTAEALYQATDRWWHGEGPPQERLRQALHGMSSLYERHAGLLRAATEVSTYDDEVRVFWRGLIERFIATTADHLEGEQEAGRVPRSLEPRATAESLVWMAERCCYIYLARGERSAPELVASLSATWIAALYPGTEGGADGGGPPRTRRDGRRRDQRETMPPAPSAGA
jgi:TetR/AcrR family transcriptional regulator, ethionamide resistance regulator